MKNLFRAMLLAMVLILTSSVVFAGPDKDQRLNAESLNYSHLHSVTQYAMATSTSALAPSDTTSTNTYEVSYLPAGITYPCKMVVTCATTTNPIYFDAYSTSGTGVYVPTSTDAKLYINSTTMQWEKVFTGKPNMSFSAPSGANAMTFEFWELP